MNVIQPQINGPLKVSGHIEIVAADGTVLKRTTEAWLCRCGKSDVPVSAVAKRLVLRAAATA